MGGLHTRVSLGLVEEDVAAVRVGSDLYNVRVNLQVIHSLEIGYMVLAVARAVVF